MTTNNQSNIELLYSAIQNYQIFTEKNLCEACPILCRRDTRWHWLLSDEVERVATYLKIEKRNQAYFFDDGVCPQLDNSSCKIYKHRPLECRLAPISIYAIENRLHWIIDIGCQYFQFYNGNKIFWDKINTFILKIRPFFTEQFIIDFKNISKSIDNFCPLIKDKDYCSIDYFGDD